MSTAVPDSVSAAHGGDGARGRDETHHAHNPHLAHHFDTPEQQFASNKLGMWVFLATEILMFGGLFCAYAVYRHNHPDVFVYAHHFLSKPLGAINTVVLITSSLTMAWGVRAAQLGRYWVLTFCLALTLVGGFAFMAIKTIEYKSKWEEHVFVGSANRFDPRYKGPEKLSPGAEKSPGGAATSSVQSGPATQGHDAAQGEGAKPQAAQAQPVPPADVPPDPNAGTGDAAKIRPHAAAPSGLAPVLVEKRRRAEAHFTEHQAEAGYRELPPLDQARVTTFFQVYFLMTGLHGLHVLVGMALIFWILARAVTRPTRMWVLPLAPVGVGLFLVYLGVLIPHAPTLWVGLGLTILGGASAAVQRRRSRRVAGPLTHEFGPDYFAPVDLVGLYWHLVDLIWIFLFPLLYLIE
jgi:cytochrome c oxidase subunit III